MNKKVYYLFLDDIRQPNDVKWVKLPMKTYTVVRSYNEFVECIENKGIPKFVAFDHDLSDDHYNNYHGVDDAGRMTIDYNKFEEKTGYDCAKFLVEECIKQNVKFPEYVVHSMNPIGAKNIISYVESYNKSL